MMAEVFQCLLNEFNCWPYCSRTKFKSYWNLIKKVLSPLNCISGLSRNFDLSTFFMKREERDQVVKK